MQKKLTVLLFCTLLIVSACNKKKPLDPLSYLSIQQGLDKNSEVEKTRTQILSLTPHGNTYSLVIALAKDSPDPKGISHLPSNAYGIRFTLLSTFTRSKEFGGGTFVFKLKDVGNNHYIVRNFQKATPYITRFPSYSTSDMDSILNPQVVNVYNPSTKECVVIGCKGTLTPNPDNPRIYFVGIELANIGGEEWSVDHGFFNATENGEEPTKIINKTAQGIQIDFGGIEIKSSKPSYDSKILGK